MKNTKQNTNNNTEDSFSERQDVTCSEGEAVTELSLSSGSPLDLFDDYPQQEFKTVRELLAHYGIESDY